MNSGIVELLASPYIPRILEAVLRSEKSSLEMIERRILAVGGDIQRANREIAGLKTDLQKKTGELRALMA